MFEPQITELFTVEDESGKTHGIMEVTMAGRSLPGLDGGEQNVSYWLADGTLVEAVAGSLYFVDRNTDEEFRRVVNHGVIPSYRLQGDFEQLHRHQLS